MLLLFRDASFAGTLCFSGALPFGFPVAASAAVRPAAARFAVFGRLSSAVLRLRRVCALGLSFPFRGVSPASARPFASPLCPAGVRPSPPCAACFGAAGWEDSCFRGDFVSVCMPGVRRPESGSRTSPVSFWMSFSSGRSSSEQKAIAVPSCPARPVRPMRWT